MNFNDPTGSVVNIKERLQWTGFGFVAGILIGAVLGWLFHGVIGAAFQMIIVAALLAPFVIAYLFWRRTRRAMTAQPPPPPAPYGEALQRGEPIETTRYVVQEHVEPRDR